MNSNEEITNTNSPSRRKFVWVAGTASLMAAVAGLMKFPFSTSKNTGGSKTADKKKITTMLTRDGRLVEVNEALITSGRKKATNSDLQNWIKK
jgi:hypothetical protein